MKQSLLALALLAAGVGVSHAQIGTGGLPLSLTSGDKALSGAYFSPVYYKAPDMQSLLQEDTKASLNNPRPYRAGKLFDTDLSFPVSGTLVTLDDGRRVWRAQLNTGDVPALLFYYDRFALPAGVKYYISNANGKQILGAYTAANNQDDGKFATQEVQGGIVNFEMDIDKNVNLSEIRWHINQAAAMYRSVSYLQQYAGNADNGTAAKPTGDPIAGNASICEINAICPDGVNYPDQRKAALRIIIPVGGGYVGFCSGTLMNTTKGDCTPYVLTATHCEENNSKVNSAFSQWIFYFNFEAPDCAGNIDAPNNQTMVGANFVARADYDHNNNAIIGDFLLLQLKSKIPASYNAYFAGWNRGIQLPTGGTSTYIGFHHPAGDMKKLSVTHSIAGNGMFNQNTIAGTHWSIFFNTGGVEGGSSGSGLFDTNGRLVGDLSGGADEQHCDADTNSLGQQANMGKDALYSKISRNWEYPEGNGAQNAKLSIWLDPLNSGALTTNSLSASGACNSPVTGITNAAAELGNSIHLFPNPVTGGTLRMRVNMAKATDLDIAIYDITGAVKATYKVSGAYNGEYTFDMSGYANGPYLLHISNGTATVAQKVMLVH